MALARVALRSLSNRVGSSSSFSSASNPTLHLVGRRGGGGGGSPRQFDHGEGLLKRLMTTTTTTGGGGGGDKVASEASDGKEVSVSDGTGGKKSGKVSPRRKGGKGLLKNRRGQFVPALQEFFPSGLGNALLQATENINRLFDNLNLLPSNLTGRVKEKDDHYKLRYEVPGLSKEDLKITVDNGVLTVEGEHKDEDEDGSEDEHWSAQSYAYYHTNVVLPEDANAEEIKAELKDGLLYVTIPRLERPKKDVKEVQIH